MKPLRIGVGGICLYVPYSRVFFLNFHFSFLLVRSCRPIKLEYPQYVCFFRIILPLFVEDLLKQEDSLYCVDQKKKSTIYLQSASFTFLISADAGKYIFNVATDTRKTSESIVLVAVILNMYLPDNIFKVANKERNQLRWPGVFILKSKQIPGNYLFSGLTFFWLCWFIFWRTNAAQTHNSIKYLVSSILCLNRPFNIA